MVAFAQPFDATAFEPTVPLGALPAGKYHVKIVTSDVRYTKKGDGKYIWLDMVIQSGDLKGRHVFDRLNYIHPNETAVAIAKRMMSQICDAVGRPTLKNTEVLHNLDLMAHVKLVSAGNDKKGVWREESNEVTGYGPWKAEAAQGVHITTPAQPWQKRS